MYTAYEDISHCLNIFLCLGTWQMLISSGTACPHLLPQAHSQCPKHPRQTPCLHLCSNSFFWQNHSGTKFSVTSPRTLLPQSLPTTLSSPPPLYPTRAPPHRSGTEGHDRYSHSSHELKCPEDGGHSTSRVARNWGEAMESTTKGNEGTFWENRIILNFKLYSRKR